ncbi:MAG: ABC transporter substrate-binding protein [Acidimicrobiales bacterium]
MTISSRSRKRPITLGRRDFLVGVGALGLAACSTGGQASSYDLGGTTSLRILNWPDYIDVDDDGDQYYTGGTLNIVRTQESMTIDYEPLYTDNSSGFDLILDTSVNSSPPLYDIVIPTNWRAAQMIANGWAEPVPIEVIPNHVNIDPAFLTNAWDRGCRFQMPWQAGITGIAYDPVATGRPLNSVNDLFDPALAGQVGFIGEMREAVGLAMLANGDDPSRPTTATAEAGLAKIQDAAASGQVGAFTFEDFAPKLASGELAAAMAWSGDVAILQADRPDIEFIVPDEGAIQWFDTMVIPAGSANIGAAGDFMNFVYDPLNAARITEWVQYISPVIGVQDELLRAGGAAAEVAMNPVLFPDAATRARLFTWGGLDQDDEDRIDADYALLL